MRNVLTGLSLAFIFLLTLAGCGNDKVVPVNQGPVAKIVASPTSGYSPLFVHFDGSSSYDSDGSIVSYFWNFKDGTTSSGSVVDHLFTKNGAFDVTLTVTDNLGETGMTAVAINVGAVQVTVRFTLGQGINDPYPDEVLELIVDGATRCRTPLGGSCESGDINLTVGDHVVGVKLIEDTGASGGSSSGTDYHVAIETDDPVDINPPEINSVVNGIGNIKETKITIAM
jgi:PKD repeat protein